MLQFSEAGDGAPFLEPNCHSQSPERPLKKLPGLLHMLLNIRLQMSGACVPVVGGIADAAGEEDEFF